MISMGFSDLPTIQHANEYLDVAFQRARQNARKHKLADYEKSHLNREKSLSLIKVTSVTDYLTDRFGALIDKYPDFDSLSEFYVQLLRTTVSYKDLKRALGALQWYQRQVRSVSRQASRQIKTSTTPDHVGRHLNQFYGRVSSLMKQIKPQLTFLHEARQIMRTYPSVKDDFTICIAGFPNVGKSTLLSKLTSATPEINSYAFTTKTLNIGYRTQNALQMQYIDTPGTLARDEKQNMVEKQASLALRYASHAIIYVFDITESCGYTITQQLKLFKQLKRLARPMMAYLSKQDLLSDGDIQAFTDSHFESKSIPLVLSIEKLDAFALHQYREKYR